MSVEKTNSRATIFKQLMTLAPSAKTKQPLRGYNNDRLVEIAATRDGREVVIFFIVKKSAQIVKK